MKRYFILSIVLLCLSSCGAKEYSLIVENPSQIARCGEIIEIELAQAADYIVLDSQRKEIPSQLTYKGNIIFQVDIEANGSNKYTLAKGERSPLDTVAIGRIYTERDDDIAWESDKIGFRMYAEKAATGNSRLYGYDIFTKRGKLPVLEILYDIECDKEYKKRIKQLKDENREEDRLKLHASRSYHIDHGLGMDYYVVGPTLGCGTSALRTEQGVHYPTYYTSYELLDAGGLRFSFKVGYDPVKIGDDMIVESRIITLDAGSHFNHVEVEYKNLSNPTEVIAGLVLHDSGEVSSQGEGYVAYAEPEHIYGWQTYNAIIFDDEMSAKLELFDQKAKKAHGGAFGHLQAEGLYTPNTTLKYYTGAAWNRWGFATPQEWFEYVKQQSEAKRAPLTYSIR